MSLSERKRPARQPIFEVGEGLTIVFVTVCSDKRRSLLARQEIHELLIRSWRDSDHWVVGKYVVMPDHIHLFCTPRFADSLPVNRWIAYWKSMSSRRWPHPAEQPIWQVDAWDTQLRKGSSYTAKWEYVRQNPVRAGLVADPNDWPFQGEMNVLFWQE